MRPINKRRIASAAAFSTLLLLSACGGGGGNAAGSNGHSMATAEGVYTGTIDTNGAGANNAFEMLVLEDGSYWALYGSVVNSIFGITGFVQGSGSSNGTAFSSSNGEDFGFEPAKSFNINASYTATPSISGAITYGSGEQASFTGSVPTDSTYSYSTPASLATVSGSWFLSMTDGETANAMISSSGDVAGYTSRGCTFTGTVAPRPSGKNVFNVSITFGGSPCVLLGKTATGIAIQYPIGQAQTELELAVISSDRTEGVAAVGNR